MDAMPHPATVCEIGETHVAAAHSGKSGGLEAFTFEKLPEGAVHPSPVEVNIANAEAVQDAVKRVLGRISQAQPGESSALLVPDAVVRVFILPFETFPKRTEEAVPLLRWRLKKSVPFDVEETVVSSMRQTGREGALEIVAGVARQRIVREYEALVEGAGMSSGVVLSAAIASLRMLDSTGATLFVRLSGKNLTTVISNNGNLCVYRSNTMPAGVEDLAPQSMLEEVFPGIAYYQDTWGGSVDRVRLAGFGPRVDEFGALLGGELNCPAMPLLSANEIGPLPVKAREMMDQGLEGMVGWAMGADD
jgi:type IV pilus assembly protein PilM